MPLVGHLRPLISLFQGKRLMDPYVDTASDYPGSRHQNSARILEFFLFLRLVSRSKEMLGTERRLLPQARFSSEVAACECTSAFSSCCTAGRILLIT